MWYDDDHDNGRLLPTEPGFDEFMHVMSATHLRRIRCPDDRVIPQTAFRSRLRPEWRWDLAHYLLFRQGKCTIRVRDELVLHAYELLRQRMQRGTWYSRDHVDAVLIYERNQKDRWLLESHLLLKELPANLPAKLGISRETIDCYSAWFFDARGRLTQSSWATHYAMGNPPFDGIADDDLVPVWKRMAYFGGERALDIAVAVTTGIGIERYSDEERDDVQFTIEQLRLSAFRHPKRVIQLDRRLRAEQNGEHPSCYHLPRRRPSRYDTQTPAARSAERPPLQAVLDSIGERAVR